MRMPAEAKPEGPLVSIYIPTRGRPGLVTRAVQSTLIQSYEPIEVLVVVDGPDPETEEALRQFRIDPRVQVVVREERGGSCRARNDAIAHARGELITGLDDDDEFLPSHVEGLVRAFLKFDVAFTCTTSILQRADTSSVRHAFEGPITLSRLLEENLAGNQVLTRTSYLRELQGFDPEMPAWQDYELWVRLCARFGSGQRIDARTYIQHLDHQEERISHPDRIALAHARFIKKHAAKLSERQALSLELLMYATSHQPFPLARGLMYLRAGLGKRTVSALISDRFPFLRTPARKLQSRLLWR